MIDCINQLFLPYLVVFDESRVLYYDVGVSSITNLFFKLWGCFKSFPQKVFDLRLVDLIHEYLEPTFSIIQFLCILMYSI
jgi:hypothetical protein